MICYNLYRYTYADVGSKHVPVAEKDSKQGITGMVGSTGAGAMLPMLAIAAGETQGTLRNFRTAIPSSTCVVVAGRSVLTVRNGT